MSDLVDDFLEALLSLDRLSIKNMYLKQSESHSKIEFIEEVVVVALERLGMRWKGGAVALSQVYMGGRVCEKLVDEILPRVRLNVKISPKWRSVVLPITTIWKKLLYIQYCGRAVMNYRTTILWKFQLCLNGWKKIKSSCC